MRYDLTILIPARQEEFLEQTIQDILTNSEAQTEIIVVLDGYLPNPALTVNDPRLTLIYNPEAKGQRAATNQAAKLAKGKYVMKADAHVAFDKGFDRKMLEAFKRLDDNVTMIPVMRNLHAFDWVCPEGHKSYQGKSNICTTCQKECTKKDVCWIPKPSPSRFTFTFDKTMHFQYWGTLAKRPENIMGALTNDGTNDPTLRETMSIQGSCFMLTKQRYFDLDISSETDFHSWGQQGVEVACKTWLGPNGGRVIANLNTWYAHMFRTNNFGGFPYSNPQSLVDENRERSRELFQRNKWPKAIHSFQWLLDKFSPPEWMETKGIIYYTDDKLEWKIAMTVQNQLVGASNDLPIVANSLKDFPELKRGHYAMFRQILSALELSTTDIVFFCEADVLYHPSHFDFTPERKDVFYFNNNVWKVDYHTKKALKVDKCEQLSGMCVYRETALAFVREKIKQIESNGFDGHYEPRGVRGGWLSAEPNVDIRHDNNLTPSRWSKEQFRNKDNILGWTEGNCPAWATTLF